MTTPVEIINGTMKVVIDQIQDSNFTIIASISSLIIAIITAISLIITGRQTQQSNRILEIDLKNRLRPIIQIKDVRPTSAILPNGDVISWENYIKLNPKPNVSFVSYRGEVKNLGSVPALEINGKWLQQNTLIKREDLEKGTKDPSFPLGVSESYPLTALIKWEDFAKSNNTPIYLGTRLQYDVLEEVEEIGKIWKISKAVIISEDYWIKKIKSNREF